MNDIIVDLVDITKSYGSNIVLDKFNLSIKRNEFVTLLGPSGCGKTTTLRIIGGFEKISGGDIIFEGKNINNIPPYKRELNTVFQKYALFPHMNVEENIAFGLRIKKKSEAEIKRYVKEVLTLVNLTDFEKRTVDSLSGGQQQRIAIARAVVNKPKLLLLDEPLGALDLKLRQDMQLELKKIQKELGITFIYVTHDQEEALTMSDRIVVMNKGLIQQMGTPQDIYNEPKNAFVADFIGESNIFEGIMVHDELVNIAGVDFHCVDKGFGENTPVDVVIRPEDVDLFTPDKGIVTGQVSSIIFKGVHFEMTVISRGLEWLVHSTDYFPIGAEVGISLIPFDIQIMKKPISDAEKVVEEVE